MITKFTPTQDLNKFLYFETNRLVVRQYILNDIQELFKIMCDVRVHTYTKDKDNPWDKGRTEEYIQFMMDKDFKTLDCFHGAVIEKFSNQLIGLCGLNPYKKEEPEIEIKIGTKDMLQNSEGKLLRSHLLLQISKVSMEWHYQRI